MNTLKITLLLGGLTGLFLGIGYYFGGQQGALIALIFSALMNFGSYWFSDRIVLRLYGAKEISKSEHPKLHMLVEELSLKANLSKPKVCLVQLPAPNAFATGRDEKRGVVAVTSGLLQLLNEQELRGVIAHELAHIKNRDILISSVAATLAGAISYLAQLAAFAGLLTGRSGDGVRGGNFFGSLAIIILAPVIATLLHLAVSRSREYVADATAARISGDPEGLASALRSLHNYSRSRPLMGEPRHEATAHLFIVNPFTSSFLTSLFSTHPPVEERVKRLRELKPGK